MIYYITPHYKIRQLILQLIPWIHSWNWFRLIIRARNRFHLGLILSKLQILSFRWLILCISFGSFIIKGHISNCLIICFVRAKVEMVLTEIRLFLKSLWLHGMRPISFGGFWDCFHWILVRAYVKWRWLGRLCAIVSDFFYRIGIVFTRGRLEIIT